MALGVDDDQFQGVLTRHRERSEVLTDAELTIEDLEAIVAEFTGIIGGSSAEPFPIDPMAQLRGSI